MNYYNKKPKLSFGIKLIIALTIILSIFALIIASHFVTLVILREKYDLPYVVYGVTDKD